MQKIMQTLAAISLITITSACTTPAPEIISVPMRLERPARPELPRISIEEANAIPYMTWVKIAERDRQRRHYEQQLELIIDSTQTTESAQ